MARKRLAGCGSATVLLCLLLVACVGAAPLTLTWDNPPADTATFLEVHRKAERCADVALPFTLLDTTPAPAATYVDATPVDGTLYCYRVRAGNPQGLSAFSNDAEKPLPGSPAAPSNLTVSGSAVMATRVQTIGVIDQGNATTHAFIVPAGGVAQGNFVIIRANIPSGTITFSSVTDTGGNTYTIDIQAGDAGNAVSVMIASAQITTALTVAQTITITLSSGTDLLGDAVEWSGVATSSALDKTQSKAPQGFGTAWTSNATATTAQADELLVGVYSYGAANSSTPTAPWIEETDQSAVIGFARRLVTQYQVVAATGAYAAEGTLSASSDGAAAIATYKLAAAGASVVPVLMRQYRARKN